MVNLTNDLPNGIGRAISENNIIEAQFKNGLINGPYRRIISNGKY